MTSSGAAVPAAAKTRIALWDNARFILIVLVVVGHAVSTVRTDTDLGFAVYAYIYLFHMPALIALSGMFSKADTSPKAIRSTIQLLAVWLIWEGIWALLHFFVGDRPLPGSWLITPAWTLWFLVSLVTMRIVLPYIARLRHPLVFSIVVALIAGLSPVISTPFSASRTLCFLPFFVAGWLATERGWLAGAWFTEPSKRIRGAAAIALAAVALAFVLIPDLRSIWRIDTWLTWRDDYAWLFDHAPIGAWQPVEWWATAFGGIGVRAALLIIAAVMTLALLILTPRGRSVVTVWGSRTLFVYLLHGPIIALLRGTGAIEWMGAFGTPGVLLIIAVGVAIAVLLSLRIVSTVFRPVIEPRLDWLFRRDRGEVASN